MEDHNEQGNQISPTNHSVDPYELLKIVTNIDGSITREQLFPIIPAAPDPNPAFPVLTRDVPLNQSKGTWLRLYLPREALEHSSSTEKLPLVVYYHGGGFIVTSAASSLNHDLCVITAVEIPVIIVSVEYRLAPEHRLPAAYDDSMEALHWIKTTGDEWLTKFGDFSNCYLMGTSAGGNIAYHVGLLASSDGGDDLNPLKIRGLILHQPYFSGSRRTGSELRLANDKVFPLCMNEVMWELALPIGVDRDHEYCNPTVGGGSPLCDQIRQLGWKVMVTGCDGDPLVDRQIELVKMLKEKGVVVVSRFVEGGFHGLECFDPDKAKALCVALRHFILA